MTKSTQPDQELTKDCQPIHSTWNELSKVWTLPVIHALGLREPARFNELKKRIVGVSATSLSERLTELERLEIVERKVYPETPPRVEYSLTKKGWELHELLCLLAEWVRRWSNEDAATQEQAQDANPSLPREAKR